MEAAHQTIAGGSIIVSIVRDMMKAKNTLTPPHGMTGLNGIVQGFLCTLGHVSHPAWTPAAIAHARKWEEEQERSAEKWRAKFAAERSAARSEGGTCRGCEASEGSTSSGLGHLRKFRTCQGRAREGPPFCLSGERGR